MYAELLGDATLYEILQRVDEDLAAQARVAGCTCGGRLHSAVYPRKPRGGPAGLGTGYETRLSYCCAAEGCRRRTTPPSVRFLGAQGVPGRGGDAGERPPTGAESDTGAGAAGSVRRRRAHAAAVAAVVAEDFRRGELLASGTGAVHAGGETQRVAARCGRAVWRRNDRRTLSGAALSLAEQHRLLRAVGRRFLRATGLPQKMPAA